MSSDPEQRQIASRNRSYSSKLNMAKPRSRTGDEARSSRLGTPLAPSPTRSAAIVLRRPITHRLAVRCFDLLPLLQWLLLAHVLPVLQGRRHLGRQHSRRLGIRHRQLRLVDRYRPRRHADLGDSAAAAAVVAQLDQPLRRSHDAVRRGVRRHVPAAAPRASVACSTGCSRIRTR